MEKIEEFLCSCGEIRELEVLGDNLCFVCKRCKKCEKIRKIEINLWERKEVREMKEKKWIDVPTMAKIVGISEAQMRYWVWRGKVPYYKIGGKVLFDENDLELIKWFISFHNRRGKRAIKEEMKKIKEEGGR